MNQIAIQEVRPWERPFWSPVSAKIPIFIYLILIHLSALCGFILYPIPPLKIFVVSLVLMSLGGLGTSVCYHRLLAHRTFTLNKVVEHLLVFFAIFNGSGAPTTWVAYHRRHHCFTDTPKDISSPKQGGFWWAHLGWIYQSAPAETAVWSPELNRGIYKFWEYSETPIIALSLVCGFIYGWPGFFWIGPIRLFYSLHLQCLVNSLTHLGPAGDTDSSQNVWWLGPFQLTAWGENWHKNHHRQPGSARLGWHWWQIDVGWYFILAFEFLGIAHKVRRPRLGDQRNTAL